MTSRPMVSPVPLVALQPLLEANPSVDWRAIALDDPAVLTALKWLGLDAAVMTPRLRAYQRLLFILPPSEDRRALRLLEGGFHSAIQVASLPRDEFARRWSELFPGEAALGEAVHRSAISRRSTLLLHHVNAVQHNEPHYRAARFK